MKKPASKKSSSKGARRSRRGKSPSSAVKSRRTAIMRHSREGMKRPRGKKARAGGAAPDPKRFYLDRLRREAPTTLRVMRALPEHAADFQPHEKSRTALGLLHTFSVENWAAILGTKGDLPMPPQFPPPPPTLEEAIANYERGIADLVDAVEAMPDSRLSETVNFILGPGKMGRIPVLELLWFMLLDSIHHRGQLAMYVRLAGGKVPSIYGPTADESWR